MCGIAGFLDFDQETSREELAGHGQRMLTALRHRGPDSRGLHVDEEQGLVLAHTRLAILDLTECGAQPMVGPGGDVLLYNGELYNHRQLFPGRPFRGRSDTEVLLTALSEWGPLRTVRESVGMFAWAWWEQASRRLWLARDRAGEKPLYYFVGPRFAGFASELAALRGLPGFPRELDRVALAAYLGRCYVPGPRSIYAGVSKLSPGHLARLEVPSRTLTSEAWWSAPPHRSEEAPASEWVARTHEALSAAVSSQLLADVPVGAFLSGGVDSSLVVALMQEASSRPVRTFTMGCPEWSSSETRQAREVARRLGTEHHELEVTPTEVRTVIPRLSELYSEPFADSSQIPTFLISRLARAEVTVALTGDGADELFGGYNRYLWAGRLERRLGWLPPGLRRLAARVLRSVPTSWWAWLPVNHPTSKVFKLAALLESDGPADIYERLVACWSDPRALVVGAPPPEARPPATAPFEEWMMERDFETYLPDDILVKVDRAAMGASLESRAPYLDARVIELSRRLPLSMKVRQGRSKWVLRRILENYLPGNLLSARKMGFSIPLARWLRGPLREWADALLDRERLEREGYLRPEPIVHEWQQFLGGRTDGEHRLWTVLMFQAWLETAWS